MQKKIVEIFRSRKKEGLYLYVEKGKKIEELPEALVNQLGRLENAMVVLITEDKKLANADAKVVLQSIEEQGFYLQMPKETLPEYMQKIPNAKLGL